MYTSKLSSVLDSHCTSSQETYTCKYKYYVKMYYNPIGSCSYFQTKELNLLNICKTCLLGSGKYRQDCLKMIGIILPGVANHIMLFALPVSI